MIHLGQMEETYTVGPYKKILLLTVQLKLYVCLCVYMYAYMPKRKG